MRSPIKSIDRFIENIFKKILYKKRNHHINKAVKKFTEKYHPDPQIIEELTKKLALEIDRLYPIVDKSILRERIKRGRYSLLITIIASGIVAVLVMLLTHGAATVLIAPLCAAFIAWVATVLTIPIGYDERIDGGMDSVVSSFEKNMLEPEEAGENQVKKLQQEVDQLKNTTDQLIQQVLEHSGQLNKKTETTSVSASPIDTIVKPDSPRKFLFWQQKHPETGDLSCQHASGCHPA